MLKPRQTLGKYRIERRLADGGFAAVYQALDTIEGIRVALKIPHGQLVTDELLEDFRHEVRLAAKLDHPNILPLKNAEFIDKQFVIVLPLGERTLAERLQKRVSLATCIDYAEQMLEAVSYAHSRRIIHCDLKPENLILFPNDQLRLTDFGIAKVAFHTIRASGSGTVGYIAPEQAMGKPSFRSDVFSLGLIIYRMLSGHLPEWPFHWPPPGYDRLRRRVHPDVIALLRRSLEIDPRKRFQDAGQMLSALQRIKSRALRGRTAGKTTKRRTTRDWRTVQRQQFLQQYGQVLETHHRCTSCEGPVSEAMRACPWCGRSRCEHPDGSRFPAQCPRCNRGIKRDWHYCAWCYGPGLENVSNRQYSDARYTARCSNARCTRKQLMPFMSYCPWCHRKVRKKWKIPDCKETCGSCGWGVLRSFWSTCPWCTKSLAK